MLIKYKYIHKYRSKLQLSAVYPLITQQRVSVRELVSIKLCECGAAAMAAPMSWRRLVYSVYTPAVAGVFTRISDRLFRARDRRGG